MFGLPKSAIKNNKLGSEETAYLYWLTQFY